MKRKTLLGANKTRGAVGVRKLRASDFVELIGGVGNYGFKHLYTTHTHTHKTSENKVITFYAYFQHYTSYANE